MLKKVYGTILLFLICLCLLLSAGCSNSDSAPDDLAPIPQQNISYNNLKPEKLTILFPGLEPSDWLTVKKEMEKRLADTIKVELNFNWYDRNAYKLKIEAISASNEIFDAFCSSKPQQYYPDFKKLAREGKIKDITNLFPTCVPTLYRKYTQQELEYAKVDGKLYAVPSLLPNAFTPCIQADESLLEKYGIDKIDTYGDFQTYLEAVKNNDGTLVPGTIADSVDTLKLYARCAGYVVFDEAQRLVYKWDDPGMKLYAWEETPEFREITGYLMSWYKNGLIKPNPDYSKTASFVDYVQASPPTDGTITKRYFASGVSVESNPLRKFYPGSDKTIQRDSSMGCIYYNGSFAFPSVSKNTERALMFLDWVQQNKDNNFLTIYGIENTHYIMENGIPKLPQGESYYENTFMNWEGSWAFKNIDYLTDNTDLNQTEKDFINKYTKYPPHGAFCPDFTGLQSAAANREYEFNNFERKLNSGQITGKSEVDSFIKNLEKLGTGSLVKEAQRQLDAWKSTQG